MKNQELEFIQSIPQARKISHAMPLVAHINGITKTVKACKLCRGGRLIAVRSRVTNTVTWKYCLECKGEGVLYSEGA